MFSKEFNNKSEVKDEYRVAGMRVMVGSGESSAPGKRIGLCKQRHQTLLRNRKESA